MKPMTTISYPTGEYKLVPVEPVTQMQMGFAYADVAHCEFNHNGYEAMLAAVPDQLPGVVAHSGEPCAHGLLLDGKLNDHWITTSGRSGAEGMRDNYISRCRPIDLPKIGIVELFTHPAPSQPSIEAIVAAALEAAADEAARMHIVRLRGKPEETFVHCTPHALSEAIRAIDHQKIIDEVGK